jgi:hypothetical protein
MADLAHAAENDTDLLGDTDAAHWAERFAAKFATVRQNTAPGEDEMPDTEGLMLTWFAGAIETGRAAGGRGWPDPARPEPAGGRILPQYGIVSDHDMSEAVHQALGVASVCWESMERTGVFDDATAKQVGAELLGVIRQYAGRSGPVPAVPGG